MDIFFASAACLIRAWVSRSSVIERKERSAGAVLISDRIRIAGSLQISLKSDNDRSVILSISSIL